MAELTLDTLMDDGGYSERARQENQAILDELERKKKARNLAVPTDDGRVKARLREIGEPITLFGERPADRRDRLIQLLSKIKVARGEDGDLEDESEDESEEEEVEEFYTEGTLELEEARRRIAEFSLPRAQKRVAQQRTDSKMPLRQIIDIRKRVFAEVKTFSTAGSQHGDERPISMVRFSPNSSYLATGSWSGGIKLWNSPSLSVHRTLRGHGDRVGGLAWHPQATLSLGENLASIVSGAADNTVNLWSLDSDAPIATLHGHEGRVCRVDFHPSGNYVASASYDTSWRLWDVCTQRELLLQEGHSKEVYSLVFQDDGALIASGGLDAIGRVWDLRTGRTAMVLDGHVQGILSMCFSPNGYQIATGSADDTIRIWDVRSLRSLYTIPAHRSNVADVRFFRATQLPPVAPAVQDVDMANPNETSIEPAAAADARPSDPLHTESEQERKYHNGLFLASAGYDGLVKLWSADDWQLLRTLTADAGKVMSVDISGDGKLLASGTYNRYFQLYAHDGNA